MLIYLASDMHCCIRLLVYIYLFQAVRTAEASRFIINTQDVVSALSSQNPIPYPTSSRVIRRGESSSPKGFLSGSSNINAIESRKRHTRQPKITNPKNPGLLPDSHSQAQQNTQEKVIPLIEQPVSSLMQHTFVDSRTQASSSVQNGQSSQSKARLTRNYADLNSVKRTPRLPKLTPSKPDMIEFAPNHNSGIMELVEKYRSENRPRTSPRDHMRKKRAKELQETLARQLQQRKKQTHRRKQSIPRKYIGHANSLSVKPMTYPGHIKFEPVNLDPQEVQRVLENARDQPAHSPSSSAGRLIPSDFVYPSEIPVNVPTAPRTRRERRLKPGLRLPRNWTPYGPLSKPSGYRNLNELSRDPWTHPAFVAAADKNLEKLRSMSDT